MSPTFEQQISRLIAELNTCDTLCTTIRTTRHLGPTHKALDQLQASFKTSAFTIQIRYDTLRSLLGSKLKHGDEHSIYNISSCLWDLASQVEPKLNNIANRKHEGTPGFRDLNEHLKHIEHTVSKTIMSLAQRVNTPAPIPQPKPKAPKPEEEKSDEMTIKINDYENLIRYVSNCWDERVVDGKIRFINVYRREKDQEERPNGFVRLPPRMREESVRKPTFESIQRGQMSDDNTWSIDSGIYGW